METFNATQKRLILVCANQKNVDDKTLCGNCGGVELHAQLKEYVREKGLNGIVRVVKSGCLDYCGKGPIVCVEPEHVWLKNVQKEDIPKLIEKWIAPLQK